MTSPLLDRILHQQSSNCSSCNQQSEVEYQTGLQGYNKPGAHSRSERQIDLQGSASGGGYGCPEGIPADAAILGLLCAFGVAFATLYRAVTVKTNARRRKRSDDLLAVKPLDILDTLADLLWFGMIFF